MNCYCCPPQVTGSLAWLYRCAYSKSDDAIWVNIYGGNELATDLAIGEVQLIQDSGYPWRGDVDFQIIKVPVASMALMLRIPGWLAGKEDRVRIRLAEKFRPDFLGGLVTLHGNPASTGLSQATPE